MDPAVVQIVVVLGDELEVEGDTTMVGGGDTTTTGAVVVVLPIDSSVSVVEGYRIVWPQAGGARSRIMLARACAVFMAVSSG